MNEFTEIFKNFGNFSWVMGVLVVGYGLHRVGLLVPIVKSTFRINGYKKDVENLQMDAQNHSIKNGELAIVVATLKEVIDKVDTVVSKVDTLTGRVDERFKSDEGYHKALADNEKDNGREIAKVKQSVARIEGQLNLREQRV